MNKIQYIKEFGLKIFIIKSIRRLCLKSNSGFAWKINAINENLIEKFLMEKVEQSDCKDTEIELRVIREDVPEEPIWVMWYQGLENAPDIVKCCVESVREHSAGHSVILLTEKNLHEYIKLPAFIMKKFSQGKISRTHLSDMIRLNLLYLYGGAWLDATLLASRDIPDEYFKKDLFSINFGKKTKDQSHGRWTTFCFFAKKNNLLIKKTLRYHYKYWHQENYPIDYVMFDYFINYIVKHDETAARQIADIETTNTDVFKLVTRLNGTYANLDLPVFSKLSWKRQYVANVDGVQTMYGHMLATYLGK